MFEAKKWWVSLLLGMIALILAVLAIGYVKAPTCHEDDCNEVGTHRVYFCDKHEERP